MNIDRFKDILLSKLPKAKLGSGRSEITCRCVYCGDSQKNVNKRSMYVSIPKDDTEPILYNCYRASCTAKGLVTDDVLMDWGIYDSELLKEVNEHNKNTKIKKIKSFNNTYKVYNVSTKIRYSNNINNKNKLDYINKRIGTNLTYDDLGKHKIILNLYDFLNYNKINTYTRDEKTTDDLDNNYIGFINVDNSLINMRCINDTGMRYVNYKIFSDAVPKRLYVMPCKLDTSKTVTVHLAEGVFDILSIYYNLEKYKEDNSMFVSIFGSSYINSIKWVLTECNLKHIDFHVYIDDEINPAILKRIKWISTVSGVKFTIHKNMMKGEKDFGVPKDRIRDYSWSIA